MHLSLSDSLACPRCGPGYGLIVLPEEAAERRVRSGVLGCPNCRERYPIEDGVADLRLRGRSPAGPVSGGTDFGGPDAAVRLAALLGLADSRGLILLVGPAAAAASAVADLVEDVEVVAAAVDRAPGGGGKPSDAGAVWSSIQLCGRIPFQNGSLQAVALTGAAVSLLDEGARVLRPVGRLLVDPLPSGGAERVRSAGLEVLAEEGPTLVARRVVPAPDFD